MCRAVNCKTCGKKTWAGCGQHVEQVMAGVPAGQRCDGHPRSESSSPGAGGLLNRIRNRRRTP